MKKEKFVLEFEMKSIPVSLLWSYIATASGLSRWFADEVKIDGKTYTFSWKGYSQEAHLLATRSGVYVRLHWDDSTQKDFFEMRIAENDLTDVTELIITDFSEPEEMDDARNLWISQIDTLRRRLGC